MLLLLLLMADAATAIRWGFLSVQEIRGLSSIFGAARKYGSGWIGQIIPIGGKWSATLPIKLNSSLFLLQNTEQSPPCLTWVICREPQFTQGLDRKKWFWLVYFQSVMMAVCFGKVSSLVSFIRSLELTKRCENLNTLVS